MTTIHVLSHEHLTPIWLCFKEEINSSTYLINNLTILTEI
jgi:hypothetical protein